MSLKTISPGPGAYETKSKAFDYERPKFYVGEKVSKLSPNTRVPFSWAYNPRMDSSRQSAPQITMKYRFANTANKINANPGPGAYEYNGADKRRFPSFGFGSGTRDK